MTDIVHIQLWTITSWLPSPWLLSLLVNESPSPPLVETELELAVNISTLQRKTVGTLSDRARHRLERRSMTNNTY